MHGKMLPLIPRIAVIKKKQHRYASVTLCDAVLCSLNQSCLNLGSFIILKNVN